MVLSKKLVVDEHTPYRRLAVAIVLQAAQDCRVGDKGAAEFLLSKEAQEFAGAWGVDAERVRKWVGGRVLG